MARPGKTGQKGRQTARTNHTFSANRRGRQLRRIWTRRGENAEGKAFERREVWGWVGAARKKSQTKKDEWVKLTGTEQSWKFHQKKKS